MPLFTAPLSGIAAAITIAAASPVAAAPNVGISTTLPINVVSCRETSFTTPVLLEGPSLPIRYDNLHISFVNRAPMEATTVRFAVSTPQGTETIVDAGRFGTGTRIAHDFERYAGGNFADARGCAVQSVTFSDGSTWQPS